MGGIQDGAHHRDGKLEGERQGGDENQADEKQAGGHASQPAPSAAKSERWARRRAATSA